MHERWRPQKKEPTRRTITGALAGLWGGALQVTANASRIPTNVLHGGIAAASAAASGIHLYESVHPLRRRVERLKESDRFRAKVFERMHHFEGGGRVEGMPYPKPGTDLGKVHQLGNQPVEGTLGVSRIQYLRDTIMNGPEVDAIPPTIKEELVYFITGLAAEESRYENEARSSEDARGILQMLPDTYRGYGFTDEMMKEIPNQVRAARKHFGVIYETIMSECGDALQSIKQWHFNNDDDEFNRVFMPIVLMDAYHAGQGLTAKVLNSFHKQEFSIPENANAYDVWNTIAHAAVDARVHVVVKGKKIYYGPTSAGYTERVFAFALLVNDLV